MYKNPVPKGSKMEPNKQCCTATNCVIYYTKLTPYKEKTMFEQDYKKYEQLVERIEEAYEFWANCVFSSWKEFFKIKK